MPETLSPDSIFQYIKNAKKDPKFQSVTKLPINLESAKEFEAFYREKKKADELIKNLNLIIEELTEENGRLRLAHLSDAQKAANKIEENKELGQINKMNADNLFVKPTVRANDSSPTSKTKKKLPSYIQKYTNNIIDTQLNLSRKKSGFPLKSLLRVVSNIYKELLKKYKPQLKELNKPFNLQKDFVDIVYSYIVNQYGQNDKNYALLKYTDLLYSASENLSNSKVYLFAGFMGIRKKENNTTPEDIHIYLKAASFFKSCKVGIDIINNDISQPFYIPFIRAIELAKCLAKLNKENIKNQSEKYKKPDPKKINTLGIIDMDLFMVVLLNEYHTTLGRTKECIRDIFMACDFDRSGYMEFFEFYIISKYIEPAAFSYQSAKTLFYRNSEMVSQNGIEISALSFHQFAELSQCYDLFSEPCQQKYINTPIALKTLVIEIRNNFSAYCSNIQEKLNSSSLRIDYVDEILGMLEKRIQKSEDFRSIYLEIKLIYSMVLEFYLDKMTALILGEFEDIIKTELYISSLDLCFMKGMEPPRADDCK